VALEDNGEAWIASYALMLCSDWLATQSAELSDSDCAADRVASAL